ncbi:MAG: PIN domain-containing protein [Pseudonocardiaceae bacterium]
MFRALLDTCVLFKPLVCDTLLCIAEEHLFQPLWSEDILDELRRSLLRYGVAKAGVDHRIGQMVDHFPGAMVTGHHYLINAMMNHPKDRHVLAAAVRGGADLIVTQNTNDFPMGSVAPYDVEVTNQDSFLLDQLDLNRSAVRRALTRQVSRYRRQPRTVDELLVALGGAGNGCPSFASSFYD